MKQNLPKTVIQIRRPYDSNAIGLNRYADFVYKCVKKPIIIESDITISKGFINFLTNGIIRPFLQIMNNNNKDSIIHATDELCAYSFPFVKCRKIITVHHITKPEECSKLYYLFWSRITNIGLKKSDKIIAISPDTAKELVTMGINSDKIHVLMHTVREDFKILEVSKKKTIGSMGELIPRKNFSDAILAFSELIKKPGMEDYTMAICGRGTEKEKLEKMIVNLNLSGRIEFKENLSDEEMVEFYNSCKLIFNTSLHEGLGLLTLESQACGTPVLHLAHAEIPKEVTKMSVACKSYNEMAEKAYELIQNNEKYEQLRKDSASYVKTLDENYLEKYNQILFSD